MSDSGIRRAESAGCSVGRWIGAPGFFQRRVPVRNSRWRTHRPFGYSNGQGSVTDGELVLLHDVQAYQANTTARTAGACWAFGPLAASAGWRGAPLCGKARPGRCFDAPGPGCFRYVGAGRWNAQWGLEGNEPSPLLFFETIGGSARRMAMLSFSPNRLPPLLGGGRKRLGRPGLRPGARIKAATWLILPVVICLSQRLSHACLSINCFIL